MYMHSTRTRFFVLLPLPSVGEGWGEGRLQASRSDNLQHPFYIRQYFMVPESQDREPLQMQPLCPLVVLFFLQGMLAAVRFDNNPFFVADEIDDEAACLLLPPELKSVKLPGLQALP